MPQQQYIWAIQAAGFTDTLDALLESLLKMHAYLRLSSVEPESMIDCEMLRKLTEKMLDIYASFPDVINIETAKRDAETLDLVAQMKDQIANARVKWLERIAESAGTMT